LLPGSRQQEILQVLPSILEVTRQFPSYDFVVAMAPGLEPAFYEQLLQNYPNVWRVHNQTHALLLRSSAAIVTSGTATLETALLGIPEVVVYKGSPISFFIAKRLISIPYIALVNLIMNKKVVTELIQDQVRTDLLETELKKILTDSTCISQLQHDYRELRERLNTGGKASEKAAAIIGELSQTTTASTSA
jgi:lipid-A-disaccharide synthase